MNSVCASLVKKRLGIEIDVSMSLPQGKIVALIGPSGSGKTSVLRLLAGLETPDKGLVRTRNKKWFDHQEKINFPVNRRKIGFVFQDYALFEHLTVSDNIGYGMAKNERATKTRYWLGKLQLDAYAATYPRSLSGGQRQRVALGRAMAIEPELLLMDEPFSALDVTLRAKIRADLKRSVADLDCPIVLVTHDMDEARRLADIIYVLDKGRIVRSGYVEDVFSRPETLRAAQILGWKNILRIDSKQRNLVSGSWGMMPLDSILQNGVDHIAFEPQYARLNTWDKAGIHGIVKEIASCGAFREVSVQCVDGMCVIVHRPWDEVLPAPGSRVSVCVMQAKLQGLSSATSCHAKPLESCKDFSDSRGYTRGTTQSV